MSDDLELQDLAARVHFYMKEGEIENAVKEIQMFKDAVIEEERMTACINDELLDC